MARHCALPYEGRAIALDAAAAVAFGFPGAKCPDLCEGTGEARRLVPHRGATYAAFEGRYRPAGEFFEAQPGTLAHFLTERYCLYSAASEGRIYRGEIHHPPWLLQPAEAQFSRNSMAEAAGLILPAEPPLLHFAKRQDMVAWAPDRIA